MVDSNFLTRNIVAKRVTPRIVRALECFIIEKCRSRNDDVLVIAEGFQCFLKAVSKTNIFLLVAFVNVGTHCISETH